MSCCKKINGNVAAASSPNQTDAKEGKLLHRRVVQTSITIAVGILVTIVLSSFGVLALLRAHGHILLPQALSPIATVALAPWWILGGVFVGGIIITIGAIKCQDRHKDIEKILANERRAGHKKIVLDQKKTCRKETPIKKRKKARPKQEKPKEVKNPAADPSYKEPEVVKVVTIENNREETPKAAEENEKKEGRGQEKPIEENKLTEKAGSEEKLADPSQKEPEVLKAAEENEKKEGHEQEKPLEENKPIEKASSEEKLAVEKIERVQIEKQRVSATFPMKLLILMFSMKSTMLEKVMQTQGKKPIATDPQRTKLILFTIFSIIPAVKRELKKTNVKVLEKLEAAKVWKQLEAFQKVSEKFGDNFASVKQQKEAFSHVTFGFYTTRRLLVQQENNQWIVIGTPQNESVCSKAINGIELAAITDQLKEGGFVSR